MGGPLVLTRVSDLVSPLPACYQRSDMLGYRIGFVGVVLAVLACESGGAKTEALASAPAATSPAAASPAAPTSEIPVVPGPSPEEVAKVTNPEGLPAYSGGVGRVAGVVRIEGDPAPVLTETLAQIPSDKCAAARVQYRSLFREAEGRTLADALVAVTEYAGYLPPSSAPIVLTNQGCAFSARTVAVPFGGRIDLVNQGPEAVTPHLMGMRTPALRIAVPGGNPISFTPNRVGQYALVDRSHPFAQVDVLVLAFRTFDVTGLDGAFEIDQIPVGEVRVSALLPSIGQKAEQKVQIEAGKTTRLDLTIRFDEKLHGLKQP